MYSSKILGFLYELSKMDKKCHVSSATDELLRKGTPNSGYEFRHDVNARNVYDHSNPAKYPYAMK